MINIPVIIIANGAAVVMLLIVMVSSRKIIRSKLPDSKLFGMMIVSAAAEAVIEIFTFLLDGGNGALIHVVCMILNSALYINNIFFALIWAMYADYKIYEDIERLYRIRRYLALPALAVVLMTVINLFTPVLFVISPENIYSRAALNFIPYLASYFYLGIGVFVIYKNRKRGKQYLFLPAIIFMIPIIIGSVLQLVFYGISLIWLGTAIALVSLYINVQNEISFTDSLSGVFTRQYLNGFLDAEAGRAEQKSRKKLAGIMLDIDRFKKINDRFGHLTGDDAIRASGAILRSCTAAPGFVSRFAGDEFIVIMYAENERQVESTMNKIRVRTDEFNKRGGKPYRISFSMGYSVFDRSSDTIDDFLNRMDSEMYADKKARRDAEL